jgi:hypothetical protein
MPDSWSQPTLELGAVSQEWREKFRRHYVAVLQSEEASEAWSAHPDWHALGDDVRELTRLARGNGHPPERVLIALRLAACEILPISGVGRRDTIHQAIVKWVLSEYYPTQSR